MMNGGQREIHLLYLDPKVPTGRIDGIISKVWEDLCDLEFDLSFGRFRGIHLGEGNTVHVTWENSFGVPFVSTVFPDREHPRIDFCPKELHDKETIAAPAVEGG